MQKAADQGKENKKGFKTRLKALYQLSEGKKPFGIMNGYNRGRTELSTIMRGTLQTNRNLLKQESNLI